jgi:penicillin-binding protein 1A
MSRRQRQRRKRSHRGSVVKRGFLAFVGMAVIGALVGALVVIGYIVGIAESTPNLSAVKPIDKGATSVVYAANGSRLGFIQNDELRTPVTTEHMPQYLRQATVAIEDQRFYKHKGVDYEGVVRAAIDNIRKGKTVQGGSTITMQLVRNLYISKERTFKRKVREAKLAEQLENKHSKTWILTNYLNNVPYGTVGGQTAIGAQAASRTFFNKPVDKLTLPEAAMLAGLPQAPSLYNPFRDPRAALARRNDVLSRMAKQGMITTVQAQEAQRSPLRVKPNSYYTAKRESYFFDYVKEQLIERYGLSTVRKGGLKIYTTIDLKKQKQAREAMAGNLYEDGDPSSAIVSIDPRTGFIRAMASTGTYKKNQFNYAAQGRRQAGSTFKVMVLMTALRQGINPETTTYVSHPLDLNDPTYGHWVVNTYSHSYGGAMNLVQATLQSDNTVYAQLDLDVGPENVKKTAQDMGITTHLDGYPAEGLGGLKLGVSPLEMAVAYATVASGGVRHRPLAVKRVVFPDGRSEDLGRPKGKRVFTQGVAYEAIRILEQNMQSGTATGASIGCPAAAKTGTVDDFTDAWLMGFTPHLSTAVWVGYPNSKVPMRSVHGIEVAGGTIPADIWHDYMSKAIGNDCSDFSTPNQSFESKPFFGQYSSTGRSSSGNYNSGSSDSSSQKKSNSTSGNGTSGSRGGYSPEFYEAPPQRAPSTGGGGGNGNGNSRGGGGNGGPVVGGGISPG